MAILCRILYMSTYGLFRYKQRKSHYDLTLFLKSQEGGEVIIKFNQMFPYETYNFQFVLKSIFVLKFVVEIFLSINFVLFQDVSSTFYRGQ